MTEQLLKAGGTIGRFSPPVYIGGLIKATFSQWSYYTKEMFVARILDVLTFTAPAITAANIEFVSVADPSVTFRIIGVPVVGGGTDTRAVGERPPPTPLS